MFSGTSDEKTFHSVQTNCPERPKPGSPTDEYDMIMEDRFQFVDLMKSMLRMRGEKRILPDAALKHNFITMHHLHNLASQNNYSNS